MSSPVKLLVSDEKTLLRKSLFNLIRAEVPLWTIHETANKFDLHEIIAKHEINMVLINAGAGSRALDIVRSIRQKNMEVRIVLLIQYTEPAMISNAIKIGVNGIIPMTSDPQELITGLKKVFYDGNYFNGIVQNVYDYALLNEQNVTLEFTFNEARIVDLLGKGNSTRAISQVTGLTRFTVDSYRKKLLQKTKSRNVAEMISLMHRTGIL